MTNFSLTPNLGPDARIKVRTEMLRDLRSELIHLKSFQIQLLTFGVTGAVILLGLIKSIENFQQYLVLFPFIILFPFWIIFFEKARTISRNVGFIRVQEKLLISNNPCGLIGFETAMLKYWKDKKKLIDDNNELEKDLEKIIELKPEEIRKLHSSHYWFTSYIIFYIISILCFILSIFYTKSQTVAIFGFITLGIAVCVIVIVHSCCLSKTKYQKSIGKLLCNVFFFIIPILIIIFTLYGIFSFIEIPAFQNSCSLMIYLSSMLTFQENLVFFGLYILLIGTFIFVSLFTYWFFYNLVLGRYTHTAFERKWWEILELNKENASWNTIPLTDMYGMVSKDNNEN